MGSAISEPLNLLFGETKFFLFHFITPCLKVDSKYPNYYDNNHKLLLLVSNGRSPHLPFVIEGKMEVMGDVGEKLIATSCAWSCVWFCFQIAEKLRRIFFCSKLFRVWCFSLLMDGNILFSIFSVESES